MDAAVADPPTAIDLASERPFRAGRASIDPVSREATFDGQSERLQPQNLKVLVALARQRSKVVTRDRIVDLCWDGRFVGEDVINRAISNLRQFADRAGGFSIETVPRAGYRLVETSPSRRLRLWIVGSALVFVISLVGVIFFTWLGKADAPGVPTFAVQPFTTASADPQERELASNARDAVAHTLSQTEFHVALVDKGSQGGRPASDFVVSGDVSSTLEKLVATVRVADSIHNVIVYSQRFETDRARAGDLPEQIGAQIAGSLGWTASLLMLDRNHPSDPSITAEVFGLGSNFQTERQIAAKAPNSAIAQIVLAFGAADALWDLPREQRVEVAAIGRRAADRARVLAPGFGANEILWCFLHSRARMIECENHLRAGMSYDPDSPWVEKTLADELRNVGRTDEAQRLASDALAHDPFMTEKIGLALRMLEATGKRDEANDLYHSAIRGWPDDGVILWDRVYGIMDRGDFGGLEAFEKQAPRDLAVFLEPGQPVLDSLKAKNVEELRRICPLAQADTFKRDLCMLALARLGDNDSAFELAFRIYPNRVGRTPAEEESIWLDSLRFGDTDILMGPAAAPLRRDPRYLELAHRLGVLDYWRSGRLPDFCRQPTPELICSQLNHH